MPNGLRPQQLKDLLHLLRSVVEDEGLDTTVRIAGGWVRDKLLAVKGEGEGGAGIDPPKDIDIALDDMSGVDFSQRVDGWNKRHGQQRLKWGIIKSNPAQSKHLETATVTIGSFDVDFVNLRTETYANDSRIPAIEIGTAYEDAMRRDLTINSLFYNVNDGQVEDFTGRGLRDLKNRVVDTPLDPLVTLKDDPLRSLRAVRFAAR